MKISSASQSSYTPSTSATDTSDLEKQKAKLEQQLKAANASNDDQNTKQKIVQQIQQQIQQIDNQIAQKKSNATAGGSQAQPTSSSNSNTSPTSKNSMNANRSDSTIDLHI